MSTATETKKPLPESVSPSQQHKGSLAILAAALLWSTAGLLIKYIPWHPMAIASGRGLLVALIMLVYYRKRLTVRLNLTTWLSGLALVATQSLFVIANKLTTAANAIMLQYSAPIFIIVIGLVLYRSRPARRDVLIMFWALAGIVLFFFDDLSAGHQLGNLLALVTGLTFAAVFVFNNRPDCHVPAALLIGQIGTFLAGLPWLLALPREQIQPMPVFALLMLGLFQHGLGYILFQFGIRLTQPLNASLLSMIEPIMNPVWVFLLLNEKPGRMALIGAVIVISAVLYLNLRPVRIARSAASETPLSES